MELQIHIDRVRALRKTIFLFNFLKRYTSLAVLTLLYNVYYNEILYKITINHIFLLCIIIFNFFFSYDCTYYAEFYPQDHISCEEIFRFDNSKWLKIFIIDSRMHFGSNNLCSTKSCKIKHPSNTHLDDHKKTQQWCWFFEQFHKKKRNINHILWPIRFTFKKPSSVTQCINK
jgi:hypothetical protein